MTDYSAWSNHNPSHIIIGSIDGAKTNYPVPIVIPYQSQMQSNYGDVRFSLIDGTNLEYDLVGYNSTSAKFNILIPSLPASPTQTPILVHSGNASVSNASNPTLVYLFYDNFTNLNNWDYGSGVTLGTNEVNLVGASTPAEMDTTLTASTPFIVSINYYSNSSYRNRLYLTSVAESYGSPLGFDFGDFNPIYWNGFSDITIPLNEWVIWEFKNTDKYYLNILNEDDQTVIYGNNAAAVSPAPNVLSFEATEQSSSNFLIGWVKVAQTTINPPTFVLIPVASFTTAVSDLSVTFNDTSSGIPTSWAWDFGDGNTSTEQNPTHVYPSYGTYVIKLTATNAVGSSTQLIQNITINPPVPVASFTLLPNLLSVAFTDTSINTPTGWIWDFGDGLNSTEQNPTHIYALPGTYTVKLTATNGSGAGIPVTQIITVVNTPFIITDNNGNTINNLLFQAMYPNMISADQEILIQSPYYDLNDVTIESYAIDPSQIPTSMQTQSENSYKNIQISEDQEVYPTILSISSITHGVNQPIYIRCSIPDYTVRGSFLCGLRITAKYDSSIVYTEQIFIQGNVFTNSPMDPPEYPDKQIYVEINGVKYLNLGPWSTSTRSNDSPTTFSITYYSGEDLPIVSGHTLIFKELNGNPDGFFTGEILEVDDPGIPGNRIYTITGQNNGNGLVNLPFDLPAVTSNPTTFTSDQVLELILADTNVPLGPCVDITINITNQNNVYAGFAGNWDTKAAALSELLSIVSQVKGRHINWFVDGNGLLRIYYTDVADDTISISIYKNNPRLQGGHSVNDSASNIINVQNGTGGASNTLTATAQNNDSINGFTNPNTGIEYPGFGERVGIVPIQNSSVTTQQELQSIVQNEVDLYSNRIYTVTHIFSRFPDIEIGQPLFIPDHFRCMAMTFVVSSITQNGDNASRWTTTESTTDPTVLGTLNETELIETIAKNALFEYLPFKGTILDKSTGVVCMQPVNKVASVNLENLGS